MSETHRIEVFDGLTRLAFAEPELCPGGGAVDYLTVRLESLDLVAHARIYDFGFSGLTAFFGGLADSWRGWRGERQYSAAENDLRLSASHLGGCVRLAVYLGRPHECEGWSINAVLHLEPGEQLSTIAHEMTSLLAV